MKLYRKVEERIIGGFHDDPLIGPTGLPFPPYIVADRRYPLLDWYITSFKISLMEFPLSKEEVWFNRKHSFTWMSIKKMFDILKSRFLRDCNKILV